MNQNRPKCHFVWQKQIFNWCQIFPLSISWMGSSGGQSARQTEISPPALEQLLLIYNLQFCPKEFSFSPFHTKALKARSQVSDYCETIKSLLSFVSCLWGGGWVLEDTSQKCPEVQNMHSNWLCISVPSPSCSLGSHRFIPTPSQRKIWVCSGWRSSQHSSIRTHVPFVSTGKWHKLFLLPVFD